MPRNAAGIVEFVQYAESDQLTSGTHVFGPFATVGVDNVALIYNDGLGAAPNNCTVSIQRSVQPPSTPDESIVWSDPHVPTPVSGIGEYQSAVDFAPNVVSSMHRITVVVPATEEIKLYWLTGRKSI